MGAGLRDFAEALDADLAGFDFFADAFEGADLAWAVALAGAAALADATGLAGAADFAAGFAVCSIAVETIGSDGRGGT